MEDYLDFVDPREVFISTNTEPSPIEDVWEDYGNHHQYYEAEDLD